MPFRDLEFSGSSTGPDTFFSLKYAGKTLVGRTKSARAVPVHLAGNVAAVHAARPGRPVRIAWASSLLEAWVLKAEGSGDGDGAGDADGDRTVLARMSGARFRAEPVYPALLGSRRGFFAFAARDGRGETFVVAAGSPAAALSLDPVVADALPAGIRGFLSLEMAKFRVAMADDMVCGAPSSGAAAALSLLREPCWSCIAGRGEIGDAFVWTLVDGKNRHAVVGVTRHSATLTILFPFIARGRECAAQWRDDGLDYYVKGELEIRPANVTGRTKAVVKTASSGGFAMIAEF